ncbi:MAG: glutathione S-transferase family protein [Parvibaculum sp.]|nr:glutathione S-transferase family protein [Parvibaculum sp.]
MKLYYADTSNPRKACALARHVDAPVEFVNVDIVNGGARTPDYLALNPNGKVPVLTEGDKSLWESNAIMIRLCEVTGSDLWPRDERQIEVLRWLFWDAIHFSQACGTLYFEHIIKPWALNDPNPNAAAVTEAQARFRTLAAVLNDHLEGRKFLVADRLSVADFALGIYMYFGARAHIPLNEFPNIIRWHDRLNELPAWREPFPMTVAG